MTDGGFYARLAGLALAGEISRHKVRLMFGARQTGKTVLLRHLLPASGSILFNLQDSALRRRFESDPVAFRRELLALAPEITHIGIDEIQKVPALLEEIQFLYDQNPQRFEFFLTGSSARKLRTHSANLLPGRCHLYHLTPVIRPEEENFAGRLRANLAALAGGFPERSLAARLLYGSLPGVQREAPKACLATLEAYVDIYLEEEIRREGLVRNVGPFHTFLRLAAIESGRQVNLTKLSQESGVPVSTLRVYYQLLVDTFVGHWLNPYGESGRKRVLTTPRFLLFDLGVRHAASGVVLSENLLPDTGGPLLEQWVGLELLHRANYAGRGFGVSFWRTATGAEVDFVWQTPAEDIPVEVKWTENPQPSDARHLETFLNTYPERARQGLVVCRCPRAQQLTARVTAIPWSEL